jgi:hypothetical protein
MTVANKQQAAERSATVVDTETAIARHTATAAKLEADRQSFEVAIGPKLAGLNP